MQLYDYKLRFPDEETSLPVLAQIPKRGAAYHVIGIHRELAEGQDLETMEEGQEPEWVEIEGWHVDVRSKTPLHFLEEWVVHPKSPIHAFA